MNEQALITGTKVMMEANSFGDLLSLLSKKGYQVIGPTVQDGAIVYDYLASAQSLPIGWKDEQDGGTYRLNKREDRAFFGYAVGPHSWKKFLDPSSLRLWKAKRREGCFEVESEKVEIPKYAFIGVRSCELHAMAVQDKVFMGGAYQQPFYKTARENLFIVAVNCSQAGGTCFCVSMKTGPKASSGFDLALTEIIKNGKHEFLIEAGTERGLEILKLIPSRHAAEEDNQEAREAVERTRKQMGRVMDTEGIKELLYRNYEHPRWEEVAKRCLSCANCTMVCPTCFCSTVEDVTDLKGEHAERWKKWDSCFTMDFSYIHGGSVRSSVKSRYRQWMTHKLAAWIDQFGTSGCVGCGRCITWCPVGIDITAEVRAIREGDKKENRYGKETA